MRGSTFFKKPGILLPDSIKHCLCVDRAPEQGCVLKESFDGMDQWQKMAFLYCCHDFPSDERKYFIGRRTFEHPFEAVLARWAKAGA